MVLGIIKNSGTATVAAGTPGVAGEIAVSLTTLLAADRVVVTISNTATQETTDIYSRDLTFEVVKTAGTGFTVYSNLKQNKAVLIDYVVYTAAEQTALVASTDLDTLFVTQLELDSTSADVLCTNLQALAAGQRVRVWCSTYVSAVTVTTKSGTTLNGTNNTATFSAASDYIELVALSTTEFAVVENVSVVLTTV